MWMKWGGGREMSLALLSVENTVFPKVKRTKKIFLQQDGEEKAQGGGVSD